MFSGRQGVSIQNCSALRFAKFIGFISACTFIIWNVHSLVSNSYGITEFGVLDNTSVLEAVNASVIMTRAGLSSVVGDVSRRAGLYSPFPLVPGGGERYFLTVALAFQSMGYDIDILLGKENVCDNLNKLEHTAAELRIPLDFNRLRLITLFAHSDNANDALQYFRYEMFFTIANKKAHDVRAIGSKFNVWMCQFPFDLGANLSPQQFAAFSQYDIVLVNSVYSEQWYLQYIYPYVRNRLVRTLPFPGVEILYPPVNGYELVPGTASRSYASDAVINIVVLGRFFRGRQSKGHDVALWVLEHVMKKSNRTYHLSLIGNIHPTDDAKEYVSSLRSRARAKNLPVTFFTNANPDQISTELSSALIFWHLTGMKQDQNYGDPASKEHFGIAIAEAMSAGCIPIVTAIGGPSDIIQHGKTGYLASEPKDFITQTLLVANCPTQELLYMSKRAIERSKDFSVQNFVKRFSHLAHKTMSSAIHRNFAFQKLPALVRMGRNVSCKKRSFSAVIVESGMNPLFEFAVRSVVHHLGPRWAMQVICSARNEKFVRFALRGIKNVHFRKLPIGKIDYMYYHSLLKMRGFWTDLRADKVLMFRTDVLMLHEGVAQYLSYDMIGTSSRNENFLIGNTLYSLPDISMRIVFSMRTAEAMVAIIDAFGDQSLESETEDAFFARHMREMNYSIASMKEAESFCPDVQLWNTSTWRSKSLPLALQGMWYYSPLESMQAFYDHILQASHLLPSPEVKIDYITAYRNYTKKLNKVWSNSSNNVILIKRKKKEETD